MGKQRVEAFQLWLLNNKLNPSSPFQEWLEHYVSMSGKKELLKESLGWQNHPAAKMWRGYEALLALYYNTSVDVWKDRGYNNTMPIVPTRNPINIVTPKLSMATVARQFEFPAWLSNLAICEKLCASHRSNLLRKSPTHYDQFGWTESDDLPYLWPTVDG